MELVKLKMRGKYKTLLTIIGFLLIGTVAIGVLYFVYGKITSASSDIEVNGYLSINYIDGKIIDSSLKEKYEVSVTNSGEEAIYYTFRFSKVRGNGKYKISSEDILVTEGNINESSEVLTESLSIEAGKTKVYYIEFKSAINASLKAILNLRINEAKITTFADSILLNNTFKEESITKIASEKAVEDEGLIKNFDDIGTSYYFRGKANNYVSFSGLTWRIVRINGDGTVRLVLDNLAESISSYYNPMEFNMDFDKSNLYTYLQSWKEEYIKEEDRELLANSKFCNDTTHDDGYNFNAYTRLYVNEIPTFNCLGKQVGSDIGLLTIDEVMLAGAALKGNNDSYYLYNSSITTPWYTLTAAKGSEKALYMFMVEPNGSISYTLTGDLYRGVRPVINLIKNIEVTGTGKVDDPYVIK